MGHRAWEKIIIIIILQRIDQEDSMLMDFTKIMILEYRFLEIWGYTLHWQWYDLMDEHISVLKSMFNVIAMEQYLSYDLHNWTLDIALFSKNILTFLNTKSIDILWHNKISG